MLRMRTMLMMMTEARRATLTTSKKLQHLNAHLSLIYCARVCYATGHVLDSMSTTAPDPPDTITQTQKQLSTIQLYLAAALAAFPPAGPAARASTSCA